MNPRRRVAREAARLLYTGSYEEYKQAKEEAACSLGVGAMPSNYEVAVELDLLAEEVEGAERQQLILRMRGDALKVMKALVEFDPRLIGSVWRGTARRGSDIDIVVYASRLEEVVESLTGAGYVVEDVEEVVAAEGGQLRRSSHIVVRLEDGYKAEVVVRSPWERGEPERCEIYGDLKRGMSLPELEKLMSREPLRRFVPQRRQR